MTLAADIDSTLPDVGVSDVMIRPGSIAALPELVGPDAGVAYLVDDVVFSTATDPDVKQTLQRELAAGREMRTVVLPHPVHADEHTVDEAIAGCAGAEVVVTFGSGTLSDIGKVAAAHHGARHVVVQSAASVNGFADDQSVLLVKGVKRTVPSGWPDALVVDIDVVAAAPTALNASGLGDMISMFTAPADWYLSSLFGMDRGFDADAASMTRRYGDQLLGIADGIGRGDADAAQTLAEFVTLSGFSMGVAHQTSPSSGMEHTVSHMLDMAKGARGEDTAHHGAQVAVATAVASILWSRMARRLADGGLDGFRLLDDADARARIDEAFGWMDADGATADECWKDYSKKLAHLRSIGASAALAAAEAEWPRHAATLRTMLESPARIVAALEAAGAPTRFSALDRPASHDDVVWALTHCHLMRNRFTIADLAFATGWWTDDEVRSVLDEAAGLGTGA
jgi:glycerol-1-phosphate dehydrogenase [NAD(P)+]